MRGILSLLLGALLFMGSGPAWGQQVGEGRRVERPSGRVMVRPAVTDRGQVTASHARAVWQGVGVAGAILITVGTLVLASGLSITSENEDERIGPRGIVGLVSLGSGLVLTPLGWSMYAQTSRQEKRERRDLEQAPLPSAATSLRLSFSF